MSASEGGPRGIRRHPTAPAHIRWIVRTLEEAGHETWAVGGAVRDVLHGVESVDWDLATRARPDQVRRLFRRTVPIGVEHGTVGVLTRSGTLVEVTTFRRDVETFGRHAVVEFADTVDEDLARRDFTVNAVAWHPLRDELHDPFEGVEDLERGVLRTVGEPVERFAEDYLRVLRALRFAGRFRLRVDPATWSALVRAVEHLDILSPERIRDELMKVLEKDPAPSGALGLWAASGALERVAPEVAALVDLAETTSPAGPEPPEGPERAGPDPWARTCLSVDALPSHRPLVRLFALLADVGRPPAGGPESDPSSVRPREGRQGPGPDGVAEVVAEVVASGNGFAGAAEAERGRRRAAAILTRLRFSNAASDRVAGNVAAGPEPPDVATGAERRRWLARTGPERLPDLARVWGARARVAGADPGPRRVAGVVRGLRAELASGVPLTTGDLALDGRDLIRMGMKPGPVFGEVLEALLDRVLEEPALNRKELLAGMVEEEWLEEDGRGE